MEQQKAYAFADSRREIVFAALLTALIAVLYMTGLPMSLLLNVQLLDIQPVYISLIANTALSILLGLGLCRLLCPHLELGLHKKGFGEGVRRFGLVGGTVTLLTFTAVGLGLLGRYDNPSPTFWRVLLEGVVYYALVAFVEELFIRGLLLNTLEALLSKTKHAQTTAIVLSSTLFSLGHIFGAIGLGLLPALCKVLWTLGMGLFLGTIYKKTGNLWLPMLLHFALDLCGVFYCFTGFTSYTLFTMLTLITVYSALGVGCVLYLRKKRD